MSNIDLFATSILQSAGRVYELSAELEGADCWPPYFMPPCPEKIEDSVTQFYHALLGHFFLADGEVSTKELQVFNSMAKNTLTREQARNGFENLRRLYPTFLREVPPFLRSAAKCDDRQGTQF